MTTNMSLAENLTMHRAAELLQCGLSNAARPIDTLVERLSEADGAQWLDRTLQHTLSEREVDLLHGLHVDEAALVSVKTDAKRRLAEASDHQAYLAAMACYCFSVARGLESHDRLMSSRSGEEWADLFVELASVAPVTWQDLLSRAAERALQQRN